MRRITVISRIRILCRSIISDEWLQAIKATVSRSFGQRSLQRYKEEFDIPDYDAEILTGSKHLADLFEETIRAVRQAEKGIELADR